LLAVLDHPEASVRQAAAAALNSIGHPRMEEAIAGRLKSDSPRVRESAARIAGYFGYKSCLRQLVELCDDAEEIVRRAAVEHLANYDERPAWSKIAEVLSSDSSATVRAAAVRAMGQSASSDASRMLVRATSDANLWVRYFAIRSIAKQNVMHADVLACLAECATRDDAPPVRIAAIETLASLGAPSMLPALLPLAHDKEIEVAAAAVVALGSFDARGSDRALRSAFENPDARLQRAALDAFAKQRATDAVDSIVAFIHDSHDDDVRAHAVHALGRIGGEAAISALLDFSGDLRLRDATASALATLDAADTATLAAHLGDDDRKRRRTIVDALSHGTHTDAAGALAAALDDSAPDVRFAAARALTRLDLYAARS
jgi:HEAT repeat protein